MKTILSLLVLAGGGTKRPLTETRVPLFDADDVAVTGLCAIRGMDTHPYSGATAPCASILFGRTGGLGDLTLLTPVLREIKRRWPTIIISPKDS